VASSAQFGLSRTGSLPCDFPDTAFGFRGHHGHAPVPSISMYSTGISRPRGKFELQCSLPLGLLTGCDITADGLSVALHRFGRDLQPGQCFQLLAPLREAAVANLPAPSCVALPGNIPCPLHPVAHPAGFALGGKTGLGSKAVRILQLLRP
jgi:hypothetical protein